jgi:hypothetical protein
MCTADHLTPTPQAGYWQRDFRLHRAAIADRLTLELGESALPSSQSMAQEFAQKWLAWDRANESSAGPVSAADRFIPADNIYPPILEALEEDA